MRWRISSLVGLLGYLLCGCQQTQIEFTDAAGPSLASYQPLVNALVVSPLTTLDLPTQSESLLQIPYFNNHITVHLAADTRPPHALYNSNKAKLQQITLVGINPDKPLANPEVIAAAFQMVASTLAKEPKLSCIDNIDIRVSLHSIALTLSCVEPMTDVLFMLVGFWQQEALASLDITTLRRQLKLNKHIQAFSGDEIDTQWRRLLLGKTHPYNQALDDPKFIDLLTIESLQALQQYTARTLNWHIFSQQTSHLAPEQEASRWRDAIANLQPMSLNLTSERLSTSISATKPISDSPSVQAINNNKIIYLIDAPDSVQTQVRVGYSLAPNQSTLFACDALANLLGRSFSGRLYYDLREVRGLTYGIYGQCVDMPLARSLRFAGNTDLAHSGAFVAGILSHLQLLTESPPSTEESAALRTYLQGRYLVDTDNATQALRRRISQLSRDITVADEAHYRHLLEQLTGEQLQQFAQEYFTQAPFILLRGDADKITDDLVNKLPDWQIQLIEVN